MLSPLDSSGLHLGGVARILLHVVRSLLNKRLLIQLLVLGHGWLLLQMQGDFDALLSVYLLSNPLARICSLSFSCSIFISPASDLQSASLLFLGSTVTLRLGPTWHIIGSSSASSHVFQQVPAHCATMTGANLTDNRNKIMQIYQRDLNV